jgi:prepilin-type N-terminal cleavage/methylation domain-containing protein
MSARRPKTRSPRAGFTLIELLVSIGIFAIVVIIVTGAISTVIDANKKSQTITSVVNNLNFTLESMTRAIKTGEELAVDATDGTCGDSVSLVDARGRSVAYSLDGGAVALDVDGVTSSITAPEIDVDRLLFCELSGDQPAVLFTVSGSMGPVGSKTRTEFHVQTTVAQRALQIPS